MFRLRFPFELNLFTYTVQFMNQVALIYCQEVINLFAYTFLIESSFIIMACTTDLINETKNINEFISNKNNKLNETYKKIGEFIRFHIRSKELSSNNFIFLFFYQFKNIY